MQVFAVLYDESDDFSHFETTLCGVYLTQEEARKAIEKNIKLAGEKISDWDTKFSVRLAGPMYRVFIVQPMTVGEEIYEDLF